MRGLGSLIKIHLNVNFGISAFKYKFFKQKKELWQPIVFFLALLSLIPAYMGFIYVINGIYTSLKSINQEGALLLIGVLSSQLILLLFGITHIFAKFYYGEDLQILIPLPVKPSTILTARFITVMINEYLTVLPIILPVLLVYGIKSSVGILYWLYSILIILTIPVIPLAFATIIVMIFMRYTNIKKNRDLIRVIGGVLMVAIILGVQMVIRNASTTLPPGGEAEYIANLISNKNSIISQMGASFPPSIWAAKGLSSFNNIEGFVSIFLFVVVSSIIFYGMIIISEKVFYKGLIGGQEVTAKKKRLTDKQLKGLMAKVRHPIFSILERDIKILVRTPIFLMNSIGSIIIIPFALGLPIFMGDKQMVTMIQQFYTLNDGNMITIVNLILSAFIIFIGATTGVSSTTFSREGKQFWISRIVPIKVEYQLIGKILSAVIIQILTIFVILGVAVFIVPLKLSTILIVTILGLLGSVPMAELAMFIDIARPLLDWDNPQKAMKQNMNVLFSMILGIIYVGICAFAVYFMFSVKLSPAVIYIIIISTFTILSIFLFKALSRFTSKRFREME